MGTVEDFYGGPEHNYPPPTIILPEIKLRFDFLLKKKGYSWLYVDSCDNVNHRIWKKQRQVTVDSGGSYLIVEATSGKIIAKGGKETE